MHLPAMRIRSGTRLTSSSGGRLKLRWGGVGLILLGIAAGAALLVVATPLGRYIARAAWEEGRILRARRPITEMVRDANVDSVTRAKLSLVLEARRYAVDSLGLPAGKAFTQFTQLDRDTLVLVLSGARRDALVSKTWWFPVVGRLPYKGYFDTKDALAAERALAKDGYDTYLRPAPAFSTLGWFNDPLLSSSLRADSVDLVNTVIHELTHNRYFAKNEAVFNESFANFVGARGAERFFLARGDTASALASVNRWADDRVLGAYWAALYRDLDSTFRAHPGDSLRAARLALRDSAYAAARRVLVDSIAPLLRTIAPEYTQRVRLDNAALMARRIYLTDLEAFERVYAEEGADLERSIQRIIAEHRGRSGP
jgi:predicted aminopeptidase